MSLTQSPPTVWFSSPGVGLLLSICHDSCFCNSASLYVPSKHMAALLNGIPSYYQAANSAANTAELSGVGSHRNKFTSVGWNDNCISLSMNTYQSACALVGIGSVGLGLLWPREKGSGASVTHVGPVSSKNGDPGSPISRDNRDPGPHYTVMLGIPDAHCHSDYGDPFVKIGIPHQICF